MKFLFRLVPACLLLLIWGCKSNNVDHNTSIEVFQQFSELQAIIDAEKNKLLVINFWATSCPPCIKEMPHFNKLEKEREDLKIMLISLDNVKDLESRVYTFVEKHKIIPEVAVLGDQNYSAWTDKIDSTWYGALPATVMIKGDERKFRFGIYESYDELQADVNEVLRR